MVREFSRDHIAPVASELDRTSTFPWENIKAMGELGLLGVPWGEELGGAGMEQLSYYITIHEMAKVDASHALTISAHTNLGTSPIVDGRLVFGDKAGWIHLLSAEDGKQFSEIKGGDTINSTPAVMDGRIYIGAFNGKLYCLGLGNSKQGANGTKQATGNQGKEGSKRKPGGDK